MPNLICLDASIIIQALANPKNEAVQQQWRSWQRVHQQFVAPSLQRFEVTNGLHRYQHAGYLDAQTVDHALDLFLKLPISHVDERDDHAKAMKLARRFGRPAAYDAHYLVLAERMGIDFWTVDRRLANAVRHALPWVHLVGDGAN